MKLTVKSRIDNRIWLILILLAAVYFIINLVLPRLPFSSTVTVYIVQPVLWLMIAVIIMVLPRYRAAGKLRMKSSIIQLAIMIGIFQVMLFAVGGLFSSFGKSPYSFSPFGIITNFFLVASMLVGMEISRAWLVNHLGKHILFIIGFVTILYTILGLTLSQIIGVRAQVSTLSFLVSTLVPLLVENLLATMLALLVGSFASMIYRGIILAFWWFCPILPDLSWSLKGLLGTIVPVIGMLVVWNYYVSQTERSRKKKSESGLHTGWIVTSIISVAIIWFSVGLLPIHPVIVGSGSMSPVMKTGDIALVARISGDRIKVNDIIEFRKVDGPNIMHRVIEIEESGGSKLFITKGDDNRVADIDPVIPENVVGRVVYSVPKIGWVGVWIKQFLPD